MFIDGRTLHSKIVETTLCIIGAGAAGIAIANYFRNTQIPILLIESGGLEPDANTQSLCEGENIGLDYSLENSRLRFFGGSTNHWGGQCAPFAENDFENRPWVPNSGWPITLAELNPYYRQASEFLNIGGNNATDFTYPAHPFPTTDMLAVYHRRYCKNLRVGNVYKTIIKQSSNIKTLLNTTIVNIQSDNDNTYITGLEAKTLEGHTFSIRAHTYVLACGGLENARLLLLSRDKNVKGLANQNDLVGRFFMEHPGFSCADLYEFGESPALDFCFKNKLTFMVAPAAKAAARYKILNGFIRMDTWEDNAVPKSNFMHYLSPLLHTNPSLKSKFTLVAVIEQAPNPDSRIMLSSQKKDALGLPALQLNWVLTEREYKSARQISILFAEAISAVGLGIVRLKPFLYSSNHAKTTPVRWGSHHMGTTRMHNNQKQGIVDKNCQVHGINNLFIAGSSVFPTAGRTNPTYTIIALALRLAEHLKKAVGI